MWPKEGEQTAALAGLLLWYVHSRGMLFFSLVGLVCEMPVASRAPQKEERW